MTTARGFRIAAACAGVLLLLLVVFGYRNRSSRWCSGCWASTGVVEYGVAVSDHACLAVARAVDVRRPPAPRVARFLPPGHVHDTLGGTMGSSQQGPYIGHPKVEPRFIGPGGR